MAKITAIEPIYRYPEGLAGLHSQLSMAVIAFHEAVARRLGMTAAERKCLGLLGELGSATPGLLASQTGLSTGAITGIVDRLEKAGYVARQPNPADRRSFIVQPLRADEHLQEVAAMFGPLSQAMTELQSGYSADQLQLIQRYLAQTTEVLKAQADGLHRADLAAAGPAPSRRRSQAPGQ